MRGRGGPIITKGELRSWNCVIVIDHRKHTHNTQLSIKIEVSKRGVKVGCDSIHAEAKTVPLICKYG